MCFALSANVHCTLKDDKSLGACQDGWHRDAWFAWLLTGGHLRHLSSCDAIKT
jgi:hypothetical protein